MTKGEMAAYLGMANVMFAQVPVDNDGGTGDQMIAKVRQALLEAQLLITSEAIEEYSYTIMTGEKDNE